MKLTTGIPMVMLLVFLVATNHNVAAQVVGSQTNASAQPKVTGLEGNLEADDLITGWLQMVKVRLDKVRLRAGI